MSKKGYPAVSIPNQAGILRFCPDLALEIGRDESLIFLQIDYLCQQARVDKRLHNYQEDHWWTYQSVRDWQEKFFKWMSVNTVDRKLQRLKEKNLIVVANHNTMSLDQTRWYRVNYEAARKLNSIKVVDYDPPVVPETGNEDIALIQPADSPKMMESDHSPKMVKSAPDSPKMGEPFPQNGTTIPKTPTETPIKESSIEDKKSLPQKMFTALADLCCFNLKLITAKERGMLNQTEKALREAEITPAKIEAFKAWWYANDWRGKQGQPPTLGQVRQVWGQFETAPNGKDSHSYGRTKTPQSINRAGPAHPPAAATGLGEWTEDEKRQLGFS